MDDLDSLPLEDDGLDDLDDGLGDEDDYLGRGALLDGSPPLYPSESQRRARSSTEDDGRPPSEGTSRPATGESTVACIVTPPAQALVKLTHLFTIERPEHLSAQTILRRKMNIPLPATESLEHTLQQVFGKSEFRGAQREAMQAALEGYDVLVIAPTGMGKSLCFQVPAIAKTFGVTLVISPLLSLIDNQVSTLSKLQGIRAVSVTSKVSREDRKKVKKGLVSGHPRDRLVYLTPEMLLSNDLKPTLDRMAAQNELARLVVDEAHIIAEWGREFRPNYARLGEFRERYPMVPLMALTASATASTAEFIVDSLQMDPDALVKVKHSVNRANIYLEVRYIPDSRQKRVTEIADIIDELAFRRSEEAGVTAEQARAIAGIVYCRQRDECDEVANFLKRHGIQAAAYHSGVKDRDMIARLWEQNDKLLALGKPRIDCVVATVAFGLGIDKPDCRYVIHFNLPKSFEGLYQEGGRAGRDGHAAHHIAFYSREDAMRITSLVDYDLARAKTELNRGLAREARQSLKAVLRYMETPDKCRHVVICQFFGEKLGQADASTVCNKMCDVCRSPESVKKRLAANLSDAHAVEGRFAQLAFEGTQQVRRDDGEEDDEDMDAVEVVVKPPRKFGLGRHRSEPAIGRAPAHEPEMAQPVFARPKAAVLAPPRPVFAAPRPMLPPRNNVYATPARAAPMSASAAQLVEDWADRRFPTSSAAPAPSRSIKRAPKFSAPAIRAPVASASKRRTHDVYEEADASLYEVVAPKRQRLATDFMLASKAANVAPTTSSFFYDSPQPVARKAAASSFATPFKPGVGPRERHLKTRDDPPSSPHPDPPQTLTLPSTKHTKPISNDAREEAILSLDKRLCQSVLKLKMRRSDGARRHRAEETAILSLLGIADLPREDIRCVLLDAATFLEGIVLFSTTSMVGYRDVLRQRLDAIERMLPATSWFDAGVLAAPDDDAAVASIIDALQTSASKRARQAPATRHR